ncbi:hypothetical protein Nepgr_010421 [Nepenthes gracilis]|uniref:Uncharacterized protein n=1 Tax=Nepenthes gracilis TaxID=150966 RepID=A0AAD3XLD3_NEPGR|nr:hypothetical protein Nepgr_010421 [Nepenthes gracilis]
MMPTGLVASGLQSKSLEYEEMTQQQPNSRTASTVSSAEAQFPTDRDLASLAHLDPSMGFLSSARRVSSIEEQESPSKIRVDVLMCGCPQQENIKMERQPALDLAFTKSGRLNAADVDRSEALGRSYCHEEFAGSSPSSFTPCTIEIMPVSEQLGLSAQNHYSGSGTSCQGDHQGGDQCSCTSLGMLRKNIEAFRMQFEVPSPRATVDYSILGSRQGGSWKKSKYRRHRKSLPKIARDLL